jgi:cytoskeleton protein RodZ
MARKTTQPSQQDKVTQNTSVQSDDSQSEFDSQNRSRCGGALRTARESQGLSIQDIAGRLRLSTKQIEAIEADNFAILPEPTIVRGFIRNYAKQLKINTEPLLDAYSVIVPSAVPHEFFVKPSANMKITSHEKPKAGTYIWAGLAVLLGLAAWLFYQNYVEKPSPVTPTAAVSSIELLPEVALPAAERAVEPQISTELPMPPADASASAVPPATTNTTINPPNVNSMPPAAAPLSAPVVSTPVAPIEPVMAPAPKGMAKLELTASQETWVNVVDATGKEVYSNTIFAGSRESVDVTLPVKVTVGNAGATNLSLNGKPVELAPHSRNNVAHITLE